MLNGNCGISNENNVNNKLKRYVLRTKIGN